MAFPVTLNGRTYTLTDFEGTNYVDGLPDAFEDFVTHAGDIYNSTSTTSNSIGTGSKTFTVEANKPYQAGTPLRIADAAAPSTNFLDTVVTSYSGTTLVVNSIGYGGSGTKTSWTVNIGGAKTVDGTLGLSQGGTGATDAAGARTNIDVYSKADADSRFLNVSGEASNVTMNGDVTIGDASSDTLTVNATADFNTGFNVDGTVTSDGLTVAGNLSVDGGTIKLDGNYPTGTNNVALGDTALDDGSLSGGYNTALGAQALSANTTGQFNTAVGERSLLSNTTAGGNVAVGSLAMRLNVSGGANTAVGHYSLYTNSSGQYNTALGSNALFANTTASYNTAVGYQSLDANTTGARNNAFGAISLGANTTGQYNTSMGHASMASNTTGNNNVALGYDALNANTTASNNTAVGYNALYSNTTGSENAGLSNATLQLNTTGNNNTAAGRGALNVNTTGSNNSAFGYLALSANTTANNNTAVGYQAGYSNTTGGQVAAFGSNALMDNTTGDYNTALGFWALTNNTTANSNTGVGHTALSTNTTGANNTALGHQALNSNTTASNNTAVGYRAGYTGTTAAANVFIGRDAGYSVTTANGNTFIGDSSGGNMTTGQNNTILGRYSGNQGGLDIRTSSNNIVLSDGDGNPRVYVNGDGDLILGGNAPVSSSQANGSLIVRPTLTGSAQTLMQMLNNLNTTATGGKSYIDFYNGSGVEIGSITGNQSGLSYNTSSDHRLKENVVELTGATTRLKQLEPKRFNFIADADNTVVDGFIAHEVQSVVPEAVTGTHNEVDADGNPVYQGIDQSKLVPLLVATIKELEARITALENA